MFTVWFCSDQPVTKIAKVSACKEGGKFHSKLNIGSRPSTCSRILHKCLCPIRTVDNSEKKECAIIKIVSCYIDCRAFAIHNDMKSNALCDEHGFMHDYWWWQVWGVLHHLVFQLWSCMFAYQQVLRLFRAKVSVCYITTSNDEGCNLDVHDASCLACQHQLHYVNICVFQIIWQGKQAGQAGRAGRAGFTHKFALNPLGGGTHPPPPPPQVSY